MNLDWTNEAGHTASLGAQGRCGVQLVSFIRDGLQRKRLPGKPKQASRVRRLSLDGLRACVHALRLAACQARSTQRQGGRAYERI